MTITIPKRTAGLCPICGHYGSDCTGPHEISPGRAAYEEDCRLEPVYADGTKRRGWSEIDELARQSWERNPTVRARRRNGSAS